MLDIKKVRGTKGIIAESKVSKAWNMHVPEAVVKRLNMKEGDILEWIDAHTDIPDTRLLSYMLLVKVKEDKL